MSSFGFLSGRVALFPGSLLLSALPRSRSPSYWPQGPLAARGWNFLRSSRVSFWNREGRQAGGQIRRRGVAAERFVMTRVRQFSGNKAPQRGSRRAVFPAPGSDAKSVLITPRSNGLYGNTVWDVCRHGGSSGVLASAFGGLDAYKKRAQAPRLAGRSRRTRVAPRHGTRGREGMRPVKGSAPQIETDFTFLIGVTNLFAFEVTAFMALLLFWYLAIA